MFALTTCSYLSAIAFHQTIPQILNWLTSNEKVRAHKLEKINVKEDTQAVKIRNSVVIRSESYCFSLINTIL